MAKPAEKVSNPRGSGKGTIRMPKSSSDQPSSNQARLFQTIEDFCVQEFSILLDLKEALSPESPGQQLCSPLFRDVLKAQEIPVFSTALLFPPPAGPFKNTSDPRGEFRFPPRLPIRAEHRCFVTGSDVGWLEVSSCQNALP